MAGAEFDNRPSIIFPALVGVYISNKSRVRLDSDNIKFKSKLNYNYNAPQPDPAVPNQSEVSIKAGAFNLNYDYLVAGTGKFDVFASAGLRSLFSTDKKEVTTYNDGHQVIPDIILHANCKRAGGLKIYALAKGLIIPTNRGYRLL